MSNDKPSKSALKRQHAELQALGESLIDFDAATLGALPLEESLLDAIIAAKSMKSHGALRRQKKLIGKYMTGTDVDALRAALAALGEQERLKKRVFAQAERARDRLLREGESAVNDMPEVSGSADAVRTLLRSYHNANNDRDEKRYRRELFRCIHQALIDQHGRLSR
ncbi:MAG: ribosome biogenesis factor YjgA [Woeseiaceae bacterium]|nr:ribosome biogenesis factor YjgA [Woeseiaceae bacterium]